MGRDWVYLVCRPLICLSYQPRMMDEYGTFGGTRIGKGNRNARRKLAPVPLCPPQIPHDLILGRTRIAAVGSQLIPPDLWHGQLTTNFVFFYYSLWGETESAWYCGHFWLIVPVPHDRWGWLWSNWWDEDWQGKPKYLEKTCPSATLSITNPTWLDVSSNPGGRGGKPANTTWAMARQTDSLYYLFIYLFCSSWGETESTWYCGHYWPIVPAPDDRWWWL
jgi:hypothetical protein